METHDLTVSPRNWPCLSYTSSPPKIHSISIVVLPQVRPAVTLHLAIINCLLSQFYACLLSLLIPSPSWQPEPPFSTSYHHLPPILKSQSIWNQNPHCCSGCSGLPFWAPPQSYHLPFCTQITQDFKLFHSAPSQGLHPFGDPRLENSSPTCWHAWCFSLDVS